MNSEARLALVRATEQSVYRFLRSMLRQEEEFADDRERSEPEFGAFSPWGYRVFRRFSHLDSFSRDSRTFVRHRVQGTGAPSPALVASSSRRVLAGWWNDAR